MISFARTGLGHLMLGQGWSAPEDFGVWSDQERAELHIPPSLASLWQSRLVFSCSHYLAGPPDLRSVDVFTDGVQTDAWTFANGKVCDKILLLPPATKSVLLRINQAASPLSAGLANDTRRLGIGLKTVRRG